MVSKRVRIKVFNLYELRPQLCTAAHILFGFIYVMRPKFRSVGHTAGEGRNLTFWTEEIEPHKDFSTVLSP
jgi:hypothetical protein